MIKNFITVALRNLLKQKFYTLLNVSGLSIGIACFVLIVLYVADEISYDTFYPKAEQTDPTQSLHSEQLKAFCKAGFSKIREVSLHDGFRTP